MQRNSKTGGRWGWLLSLLSLSLLAGACSDGPTSIGVGLPDVNANTGAYLIDTVTVRASTVLRDSVVTSASNYLAVGRYTDPLLGTVEAKSYFRVAPTGAFTPESSLVYDSVALVLDVPSGATYRYGDTTKVQTLFAVYPMTAPVSNTQVSFASRRLTKLSYDSTQLLNATLPIRRARPNIKALRLRLRDDFGRNLLAAGKAGRFQDANNLAGDFVSYLPGLAVVPGATDDAAIMLFNAASTSAGLYLYYHSPADATTALSTAFLLASGDAHCFQLAANRNTATVRNLPTRSLQQVSSALTGERTFIEGGLGLQTRLEFPYLNSLRLLGQRITITQATLVAQVPAPTLTPYAPAPPGLSLRLANANNQPTTTTAYATASYTSGVSAFTGLDQGAYTWQLTSYIQGVLNNTQLNNGFLVSASTVDPKALPSPPELPTRVALASQHDPLNRMQLRIYAISLQ